MARKSHDSNQSFSQGHDASSPATAHTSRHKDCQRRSGPGCWNLMLALVPTPIEQPGPELFEASHDNFPPINRIRSSLQQSCPKAHFRIGDHVYKYGITLCHLTLEGLMVTCVTNILYIQRLPQRPSTIGCYWPCRDRSNPYTSHCFDWRQ
jgi:hypothetical protein